MKQKMIKLSKDEMCNIHGGEEMRIYTLDEYGNVIVKTIVI